MEFTVELSTLIVGSAHLRKTKKGTLLSKPEPEGETRVDNPAENDT
jgi:hypothetical protein